MPFQPINFAGIAPQGYSALDEFVQNLKGGMETAQLPEKALTENELRKAQALKASQEGRKAQMIADILNQYSGGGQGTGGASGAVGAEGGTQGGGDDFGRLLFNKLLLGQAETPSMQMERDIKTARAKELAIQDLPTTQARTKAVAGVNQVPSLIKNIESLINLPSPSHMGPVTASPSDLAEHEAAVGNTVEALMAAKGWGGTDTDKKLAHVILGRHPFESEERYKQRLRGEIVSTLRAALPYYEVLNRKVPKEVMDIINGKDKRFLPKVKTKTYRGKTFIKKEDGRWYPQ